MSGKAKRTALFFPAVRQVVPVIDAKMFGAKTAFAHVYKGLALVFPAPPRIELPRIAQHAKKMLKADAKPLGKATVRAVSRWAGATHGELGLEPSMFSDSEECRIGYVTSTSPRDAFNREYIARALRLLGLDNPMSELVFETFPINAIFPTDEATDPDRLVVPVVGLRIRFDGKGATAGRFACVAPVGWCTARGPTLKLRK